VFSCENSHCIFCDNFAPLCCGSGGRVLSAGGIGREMTRFHAKAESPQKQAGCPFPPHLWKDHRLMMPSEALCRPGLGKAANITLIFAT